MPTTNRIPRTAVLAAAAATAALGFGTPASAKPIAYSGKTKGGYDITFTRSGGSIKQVRALVPTTCVPAGAADQAARAGGETFTPPGRLRLGPEVRKTAVEEPMMHYNEVTKNYRFTARARRNGTITGRLHVNFSFQTLGFNSWGPFLLGWVCQGDDTFRARPVKR